MIAGVELQVGLADSLIICMRHAGTRLPVKLLCHMQHGLLIFLTLGRFGYCHEADVEGGKGPILVEMRLRPG